jgi:hypothetical protein
MHWQEKFLALRAHSLVVIISHRSEGGAKNVKWPSKMLLASGIQELATLTERFAGALGNCFFTDDRSPDDSYV